VSPKSHPAAQAGIPDRATALRPADGNVAYHRTISGTTAGLMLILIYSPSAGSTAGDRLPSNLRGQSCCRSRRCRHGGVCGTAAPPEPGVQVRDGPGFGRLLREGELFGWEARQRRSYRRNTSSSLSRVLRTAAGR
jgi:hypothetical protein